MKIKVSSISNFTFKDELENIYTKNNIESKLNEDASNFEDIIRNNLSENLTTILADFKTYIKNENNPSKINKQIEKLSTDFGNNIGTRAANELRVRLLTFE